MLSYAHPFNVQTTEKDNETLTPTELGSPEV